MSLRVLGAGLGRTGTLSLKIALEKLLGLRCYHGVELLRHPEHIALWRKAARGEMDDWSEVLGGYAAAVDEPPAAFWRQLIHEYPDALVLLSVRDSRSWWESANATTFAALRDSSGPSPFESERVRAEWAAMSREHARNGLPGPGHTRDEAIEKFERHNQHVREVVPADRLLEWSARDGWEPLCRALGVPVPEEPFPHESAREEWRARM